MNVEVNNTSLLQAIKSHVEEQSKSIKSVFPKLLSATFSLPIVDRNLPAEPVARIAHISKEALTLFAKALVIGAAIYTVSLTFTFLKVLAVGVVFSSIIYKVAQKQEYMDAFATKAHQFWSSVSTPKTPVVEVVDSAKIEKNDEKKNGKVDKFEKGLERNEDQDRMNPWLDSKYGANKLAELGLIK